MSWKAKATAKKHSIKTRNVWGMSDSIVRKDDTSYLVRVLIIGNNPSRSHEIRRLTCPIYFCSLCIEALSTKSSTSKAPCMHFATDIANCVIHRLRVSYNTRERAGDFLGCYPGQQLVGFHRSERSNAVRCVSSCMSVHI